MRYISSNVKVIFLAMTFIMCGLQACAPPPPAPPSITQIPIQPLQAVDIDHSTFAREVLQYPGSVVVLFYNGQFEPSRYMEQHFENFVRHYGREIKFCKFFWNINDDRQPYRLEMLPTIVLYRDGDEFDRIRGIPERVDERREFNADIDLWLQKNALGAKGDEYTGIFYYRFKNSSQLKIDNY